MPRQSNLALVGPEEALCERYGRERRLRELIEERDRAEATMKRTTAQIRILGRQWADDRRQLTMPTIDQLRRELSA